MGMDNFFRENEVKIDSISGAYAQGTLDSYASYLINNNQPFSYIILDVDNFTYITDAFGHEPGNKVLYEIAGITNEIIREKGYLARNNGDEFALVLNNITDYDEIWGICHTIMVKVNEISIPEIGNQTLTVTMGVARFPENAEKFSDLLSCAEKALYRGKSKGRNCFIIYLPEKHASIVPKSEKQRAIGSMNLHSSVFKFLTATDDLAEGIRNLLNFISSYFEIDHVCIQTDQKILFQKIHQMSKTKDFRIIPSCLIEEGINKLTGVLYLPDVRNLLKAKLTDFYELCKVQKITATCLCEISFRGEKYGILRADMTGSENENRLWQYSDMDLLLTAARTIGLILHYSGKSLKNL